MTRSSQEQPFDAGLRARWIARYDYGPTHRLHGHRHVQDHQLFLVTEGRVVFLLDGIEHEVGAGAAVLVQPGVLHGLRPQGTRTVRTLDCKFRIQRPALGRWIASLPTVTTSPASAVREAFVRALAAADGGGRRQVLCGLIMAEALLALEGSHAPTRATPAAVVVADDAVAAGLLAWIEAHHAESIDGLRLERACGYGYRHLSARCRAAFSCTPLALVHRVRVAAVQRRLLGTDEPVARCLLAAGFASAAHGTRIFTAIAGCAPGAWRRRERDGIGLGVILDPTFDPAGGTRT